MKILHVTNTFSIGGTESVIKNLSILSKKNGDEVTILTLLNPPKHSIEIIQELKNLNITLISVESYFPLVRQHTFLSIYYSLRFINTHLKQTHYDIIHTHMFQAKLILAITNMRSRKSLPLINTEHVKLTGVYKLLNQWINSKYTTLVFVSHASVKCSPRHVHRIIPNGVDLQKFYRLNSTTNSTNPIQACCIGRLCKEKGMDLCIKAISKVKCDIHLTIVGDGGYRRSLVKLIKHLGLEHKVTLIGWQYDSLPSLLNKAHLYIQPSREETYGLAALEAMACGLPVITSNEAALVETVANAGLVFPMIDINQLAEKIDLLATNQELRETLHKYSLQRSQKFSMERMWKEYNDLYQKILNK